MAGWLAARLLLAAGTVLGVTAVTFFVVYRIPADPAAMLAGQGATPEVLAGIRRKHGLDLPVWEQYGRFVGRLARGDLGESFSTGRPVLQTILERLPATAQLAGAGWLCWLLVGTALGTIVAARPTPARENALLLFSVLGVSTPSFWVGILLLYVFVGRLRLLPAGGMGGPEHLVLPLLTLSLSGVAYYARLAHSSMTNVLGEDYIRTAAAKGLGRWRVITRHALRNALLPLVTIAGTDLAALLGGVVFTESVFAWNGLGSLAVEAVGRMDIPLIVGVVLFSALFVVTANLVVDLLYPLLDPRIRR